MKGMQLGMKRMHCRIITVFLLIIVCFPPLSVSGENIYLPTTFPQSNYTPFGYLDNPYHTAILNRSGILRSIPPLGFGFCARSLALPYEGSKFGFGLTCHCNFLSLLKLNMNVIGNVKNFANEDKLAAYLGIVPRVSDSNETIRHWRITKHGSPLTRTTLMQRTLSAKLYSPYLWNCYERIKRTCGSGKALIATARKLLGIIYKTLTNGWIFEDFSSFVIANT